MSGSVAVSVADHVATVTLNRPRVMNALDAELIVNLRGACERVQGDDAVRAVVLCGTGPAFCAGGDVSVFHANPGRAADLVLELARELHRAILALRRAPKPVIASVHGAVAGAGMSLMAAADIALAADDTQFTLAYSKLGASPDGGATHFLPRLIGVRKTLELVLLSETFGAVKARELGLVNEVVPAAGLVVRTGELAARLAHGATTAFAEAKALVNRSVDGLLEAQLEAEARAFARCAATADFAEGVRAFVEKRKPVFTGK